MSAQSELIAKLQEIFQTDRADLDFGIYKILNTRRKEINGYLQNTLPRQIRDALAGSDVQETAVYNHLLTFFSRYYEEGDFISQRRYKGDTYAIPYAGEEVLLHWANKDQYYTKSGENFSNYRFTLKDEKGEKDERQVFFKLVQADTAKDNQKDNEKSRLFVLAAEREAEYDDEGEEIRAAVAPISTSADGKTLTICFEYKALPKGEKQKAHSEKALAAIREHDIVQADWAALFELAPTEKDAKRTVLEKHLADYTAKNSADYFIHKDLGGFLQRELDFYIKNEVMDLDNIQHEGSIERIADNLKQIQTLRAIAQDIIAFLAQLENFQKKLWLKKKFVVGHHYLITLDRIPATFHAEIIANAKQQAAWQKLFNTNKLEILGGGVNLCKTDACKHLVVDTSLFPPDFQTRLLSALSDSQSLDTATDGILIHSDNFQALNLLQARYREQVKCIYIDPPYNTGNDGFIYKDGYQKSSWSTLIENRLNLAKLLLRQDGVIFQSVDDNEQTNLKLISDSVFGKENFVANTIIDATPKNDPILISTSHEYMLGYFKDKSIAKLYSWGKLHPLNQKLQSLVAGLDPSIAMQRLAEFYEDHDLKNDNISNYRYVDERGIYRTGPLDDPQSRGPKDDRINPKTGNILKIPSRGWSCNVETWQDWCNQGLIHFPDNDNILAAKKTYLDNDKLEVGRSVIKVQTRKSTSMLNNMFNAKKVFNNPKPIDLIKETIDLCAQSDFTILDYFAGSGTTAHAVINLNREDGGKRKYILVEQGEYFDTVLKPRVQKVIYSQEWKDGKPVADKDAGLNGVSQMVKVLKLESYEDTLNNLVLQNNGDLLSGLPESAQQDYLLHYMLDIESRDSLLSSDVFHKPFSYRLNIAADSAGAYVSTGVDLVETFNYLIGLRVRGVEDKRFTDGYVFVEGYLKNPHETILLIWRDCERWDYDKLPELLRKKRINPQDGEYEAVYINGDHTLPTAWQSDDGAESRILKILPIEAEFLRLMFAEA